MSWLTGDQFEYQNWLFAFGAVVLMVLIYFAGVQRGKRYRVEDRRQHDAAAREGRIGAVVDEYCRLAFAHPVIDSGVHAVLRVDVDDLGDDGEIREVLGHDATRLERADLRQFFDDLQVDGPAIWNYQQGLHRFTSPWSWTSSLLPPCEGCSGRALGSRPSPAIRTPITFPRAT